jgi:predicted  nucleic acid-binding Zn-ribbon protein
MINLGYWWECFKAKIAGWRDGKYYAKNNEIPWKIRTDDKGKPLYDKKGKKKYIYPEYELKIAKLYNSGIKEIIRKWEEKDKKLKSEYCSALIRKKEAEELLNELDKEYEEYKQEYKNLETQKRKCVPPPKEPKWWYRLCLILIGLFEVPFNAIAFRAFREAEIFNYAIAILIGLGLVISGHFVGKKIKEKELLEAFLWSLIPLLALLGISYMRKEYLMSIQAEISPIAAFLIYWIIGIFIFAFATLISYSFHEDRKDVQTLLENLKDLQKRLKKLEPKINALRKEIISLQEKIIKIDNKREEIFNKEHLKISQCVQSARSIITTYRRCLLKNYPQVKNNKPPSFPDILREEDESHILCVGESNKLDRNCV